MAARDKKRLNENDSDSDVFIDEDTIGNPVTRWVLRPWILLVIVAGIACYFAGTHSGSFLPDLAGRREFRLKAEDIRFTAPPAWVPETFLRQVIREGVLSEEISVLDDRIVDQVAAAFQKHPWVERVISVRKEFPRRLSVSLEYRKPVAVVVIDRGRYPVDKNAVVLPPPNFKQDADELPVIRNARSIPPDQAGVEWRDRTVAESARLAEVVGPSWKKLQLESIEIPDDPTTGGKTGERIFTLRTTGGSRIIWGRAPGTDHPGELTPEQKLGRLEEYFTRHGGFSDEHGAYEIDIRHWKEITRLPLPERLGLSRE
jgi:hypothetical protein